MLIKSKLYLWMTITAIFCITITLIYKKNKQTSKSIVYAKFATVYSSIFNTHALNIVMDK